MKTIRIGAGAGYAGDRIPPAIELIEHGRLDYVVFECLAERTIALAQLAMRRDPEQGYDPLLRARITAALPVCRRHGTKLISNMGAANPLAAIDRVCEIATELKLDSMKVAAITGDDILPLFTSGALADLILLDTGEPVSSLADRLISANAYIGADPIREALAAGADVVIGGRIADPSLFLGPLLHEFQWPADDVEKLGAGILVGHLLECAGQLSGGYFADPPYKQIPNLANLGFPFAEVTTSGRAEFSKLEQAGGAITIATVKEQLLYEIHDPAHYLTPDVTADFSAVTVEEMQPNRVRVSGANGTGRPDTLKASLGYRDGFIGEGQISYAGAGAETRGRLAIEIVREQLAFQHSPVRDLRCELIGVNSIVHTNQENSRPPAPEVRVRIAGRFDTAEDAEHLGQTVEALYTNGPAAGGGAWRSVRPVIAIASTLVPREYVTPQVHYRVTSK